MLNCKKNTHGLFSFLTSRYALRNFLWFFIPGIIAVLVAFYLFYFQHFADSLQQSTDALRADLRFSEQSLDSHLKDQLKIAMDIADNPAFTSIPWGNGNEQRDLCIDELRRYMTGNSFISDIGFIRMSEPDQIYLRLGKMPLSYMFKHFYQYQTLSEKNFLPAMTYSGSISVYPVEAVKAFNRADAFLTVAHSLPSGSTPSKMVIFFISKSRIDTLVSNLFGNAEGALYITDSDGTVIYAYNCNNSVDLSTNEIEKILSDQLQSVSIQGRDYLITADKENLYGWNYLLLSDQKQLFSHQYYLCKIMIFWLVFALLIVFVISTLLAMLNYKPIYRLMQLIPTNIKSNLDATAFQDEFQLIELIVEQSIDEKRSLQKKLFLSNLLWGQFDSSIDVQQTLQDINLSMEYDGYLVAILSYNNQSIEPKRLPTVLLDIETQIDNNYQQAVGMELYDQSGIVVLINYSTQHLKPDIIGNFLAKWGEQQEKVYHIQLTVAMGQEVKKATDCSQSFAQARQALFYRNEMPDKKVLLYDELENSQNLLLPHSYKSELLRAVRQGRMDAVESSIEMIKSVCRDKNLTPNQMRYVCYSLVDSLATLAENLELDCDKQIALVMQHLLHSKDSAYFKSLTELCTFLCDSMQDIAHFSSNNELQSRILEVIEERLCDSALSLEGIADTCGITPSYLGRYFKKQTGFSPMQYVDIQRMNLAKELLLNTELPLKQIVAQVGYIDESNFIRKFKRQEQVTPIKFRQNYRQKCGVTP